MTLVKSEVTRYRSVWSYKPKSNQTKPNQLMP